MEINESLIDTAIREVEEESGIELKKVYKSGFISWYRIKDSWREYYGPKPKHIEEHVSFAEINWEPVLSDEHSEYKWFTIDEAMELLTFGDNGLAFQSVVKALNGQ